jgi:transposase-like protein
MTSITNDNGAHLTETFYELAEAARIAQVSPETIRYWIKTKRIQTVPKRVAERSGKPYGQLVPRSQLLSAMPDERIRVLKNSHPGKLLTVREISRALQVKKTLVYILLRRYNLQRYQVDGWNFLVDGEELWGQMEDDPIYCHLLRQHLRI